MSNVRIAYDTFQKTAPSAQAALLAMGKTADDSGLDKELIELVKLRVSQINNCAFCLQIHLNVSRKLGVPQEKLDLVATWHEAGIFSDKECAALAWAETLTRLADRSVPDEAYEAVRRYFNESELVFLSTAIATINAWNRLGAAFRHLDDAAPHQVVGREAVDPFATAMDLSLGDLAALGQQEGGDRLQGRRLARAVGAQQRHDAAFGHRERDALQHEDHVIVDHLDIGHVEDIDGGNRRGSSNGHC